MKRIWHVPTAILLIFLATVSSTIAGEKQEGEEQEAVKVDEIVVTATRTEKSAETAPASVSVVTREDIQR